MKIDSSIVGMESAGSYKATSVSVRHFAITDYQAALTAGSNALYASVEGEAGNADNADNAEGMENTKEEKKENIFTLEDWQKRMQVPGGRIARRSTVTQAAEDIRQTTLRYIFDLLFSARRERFRQFMNSEGLSNQSSTAWSEQPQSRSVGEEPGDLQATVHFGVKTLQLMEETIYTETQSASFSTTGTVKTADGREISFHVNVGMSRSFQQTFQQELDVAAFTMCDPLVINLDGNVAELSEQTFYFDIDGDGEKDRISELSGGSGYLALDKNGDGVVNDGSELFGTTSGDGFADLARYDEDGNGWIDEADAIWDRLQIWCRDENGNDLLYRLADKGVGAICLQRAATDFSLLGQSGQTKGAIRSTGVFLYENGNVGTMQHVDVAKYETKA